MSIKEPKVSVLQANVNLVQKRKCWTWNQRLWEARVLFPLRVAFFTGYFSFHVVNPLMPMLALLAISSSLWKPQLCVSGIPVPCKRFSWMSKLAYKWLTYNLAQDVATGQLHVGGRHHVYNMCDFSCLKGLLVDHVLVKITHCVSAKR